MSVTTGRVEGGDITAAADIDRLIGKARIDIVYTDPPWGPGNLRYWSTTTGAPLTRWEDLLEALACVADRCRGPVFIEQGIRFAGEVVDHMEARGHPLRARWTTRYGSPKRPAALLLFGEGDDVQLPQIEGLGGVRLVLEALRPWARQGAVVLDPCAGLGTTCAAGRRLGLRVLGLERCPKRAARARARL